MNDWAATYEPWTPIDVGLIPVPWAAGVGVPVSHVELPGPVAAASAEAVVRTCQALAYARVCQAAADIKEHQEAVRRWRLVQHFTAAAHAHYEPPLAHLVCPECGEVVEAWVEEDGLLQEVGDLVCREGHSPAIRIELRDGSRE